MPLKEILFDDEMYLKLDEDFKISEIHAASPDFSRWLNKDLQKLCPADQQTEFARNLRNLSQEFEVHLGFDTKAPPRIYCCRGLKKDNNIILLLRDITEVREKMQQKEDLVNRLHLSLSAAKMGVWLAEFPNRRPHWDDQTYALHGMRREDYNSPEEVMQAMIQRLGEKQYKQIARYHDERISQGEDILSSYSVTWPNGEVHYLRIEGRKVMNSGKLQYFGIARDITEEVVKEKLVREQESKMIASAKMAALGEMSAGVAHEINNPLTVIQSRSFQLQQMAESGKLESATIIQAAESISKTADRIARIIHSLRTFSRDGTNDPFDIVHIKRIIDETLEFCENRFYSHDIKIIMPAFNPRMEIECQQVQIEQVLLNLLNNSFDAIKNLPEKWILIDVVDRGSTLEIQVIDSGPGIPIEIADRMMEPFFTTKEVGHGTGLGLSISKGILEAHRGELVYDTNSANTKFIMRLPKIH